MWATKKRLISLYISLFVTIQHSNARRNTARMYSRPGRQKPWSYLLEAPQQFVKTKTVPQCINIL